MLLLPILSGCGAFNRAVFAVNERTLPDKPGYVAPVEPGCDVPGDDILKIAGCERAGRVDANAIIVCFADWYGHLQDRYIGQEKADAILKACRSLTSQQSPPVRR